MTTTLRAVFSKIIKPTLGEKCKYFPSKPPENPSRPNEYRFQQSPILDKLIETNHARNKTYDDDDILEVKEIQKVSTDKNIVKYSKGENKYILYYPKDYNSLTTITTKQCIYNTSFIIGQLLLKSINFFKIDIKGNTPLYYVIQSGNYVLLEKIVTHYKNKQNYPLQSFIDKNNLSPILQAYKLMESMETNLPDFSRLNDVFIEDLLKSADINYNIPKNYRSQYLTLIGKLYNRFYLKGKILANKISNDDLSKLINKINDQINLNRSIGSILYDIHRKRDQLDLNISIYEEIIDVFEQRYDNILKKDKVNEFLRLLIDMGKLSIGDLIVIYYFKIIRKQIRTSNIFNEIDEKLYADLDIIIRKFLDDNIESLVRKYYNIMKDIYDRPETSSTPINDFLLALIDHIALNGIIQIDSEIYNNIKRNINTHMNELIMRTLNYNRIIIDVFHRWVMNYYYSIKTCLS